MQQKLAKIKTELKLHQQRVVDRLRDQPGLVVAHGVGSGKSLASIAAADALGGTTRVVVPAALQENYAKELKKHRDTSEGFDVETLQGAARRGSIAPADTLIVDEAHRSRSGDSATHQVLAGAKAKKRLLLTGTPLYNRPYDIAPLVNLAAGEKVLPGNQAEFEKQFVETKKVDPGFWAKLRGIKPGEVRGLKNTANLREALKKWVDYHENSIEGFPQRREAVVETPMSGKQLELYKGVLGDAPAWLRYKIRRGLPPSKQESKDLNAFMTAARQASLSPSGLSAASPEEAVAQSPKLQEALRRLEARRSTDPTHRAVVYSNYLGAGLDPYEAGLKSRGIPYARFTGEETKRDRDAAIAAYNAGETPTLLLSGAGGEGLDLKGTRQIQLLDPHWNRELLEQVVGRGIRYQSHEALPEDQRSVDVEHYVSTLPQGRLSKLLGRKRDQSTDEYLRQLSAEKARLNDEVRALLRDKSAMLQVFGAEVLRLIQAKETRED